ncbi:DMT family transporter [Nesterenkonia haasae]|uniref:DMT family transporter n=1 Tax=Nesterenkonia haasae TaxID=2587813 RepID=UPI00192EF053|nr:DMT family transporter [Nesterenkonia haasae]
MSSSTPSAALPAQFLALSLAWGSSFLLMSVGVGGLSPLQVAAVRMALGAATLGITVVILRMPLPRSGRAWGHISVTAVFLCVIPFSLFAWAGQHISSGLMSIFNATTPLMTLMVSLVALRAERPHKFQLAGLVLGLAGVLLVLAPWKLTHDAATTTSAAQLACLAATVSYGIAFVYLRKFVSPLGLRAPAVAATQVSVGAVLLLMVVLCFDRQPMSLTPEVVVSMVALGVVGTGFAYIWNTNIVAGWGAAVASSVTYTTPVIGVALGFVVLGEHISWNQPVGAAIVIVAILLSRRKVRLPAQAKVSPR